MIVSQQARRESVARWIGSFLGLVFGVLAVLYLNRQKPDVPHNRASVATTNATQPSPAPPSAATVTASVATVTATIVNKEPHPPDVEHILESLRRAPVPGTPKSADAQRLAKLQPEELQGEVQSATSEAAAYEAEGRYAPERHAQLYRRVNVLFDVRGLTRKQNEWLAQAVQALNEIAVRHAESALRDGNAEDVLRTAEGFGEWGYRLTHDQEKRLTVILRKVAADDLLTHQ